MRIPPFCQHGSFSGCYQDVYSTGLAGTFVVVPWIDSVPAWQTQLWVVLSSRHTAVIWGSYVDLGPLGHYRNSLSGGFKEGSDFKLDRQIGAIISAIVQLLSPQEAGKFEAHPCTKALCQSNPRLHHIWAGLL